MHPLMPDLTALSLDELHQKFSDLQKRMGQAYRFGSSDAVYQLGLFIQGYQAEINRRNDKLIADMAEKSAEFKHIIDIK